MWQIPVALGASAIAGGLANWLSGNSEAKRQNRAAESYDSSMKNHIGQYEEEARRNADRYSIQSQQYMNDPSKVQMWLNPNTQNQLAALSDANRARFAAGGKMLSGAEQRAFNRDAQEQAKLSWSDAFNMMNASNSQGLSNLSSIADMRNDMAGNVFNAWQGAEANKLGALTGQKTSGFGDFLSGFGSAAGGMGSIANAFRSSK